MHSKFHRCWLEFLHFFSLEKSKRKEIDDIKNNKLMHIEKIESERLNHLNQNAINKALEIDNAKDLISESAMKGDVDSLKKHLDSLIKK